MEHPLDLSACLWKIQETTNYVRGQCGDIVRTIQTVEDHRTNDSVSLTKKLETEREREVEDQEDEKEEGRKQEEEQNGEENEREAREEKGRKGEWPRQGRGGEKRRRNCRLKEAEETCQSTYAVRPKPSLFRT